MTLEACIKALSRVLIDIESSERRNTAVAIYLPSGYSEAVNMLKQIDVVPLKVLVVYDICALCALKVNSVYIIDKILRQEDMAKLYNSMPKDEIAGVHQYFTGGM